MADEDFKLSFSLEDGEDVELFIIEQTKINGVNYLLVTDSTEQGQDADAFILKEEKIEGDEIVYDAVEDEQELIALSKVFAELVEDANIELE